MTEITSKNNQIFKLFQKLETKKYRDKLGLYIIEGENLIEEALNNGAVIDKVIIRKGDEARLLRLGVEEDKVLLADKSLFNQIGQTQNSQGIVAAVKKPVFSLEEFLNNGAPGNFVVLDRLQDPGNIGTIIRTADAAGYTLVIALKGTADIFSPKVVRAATGSLFRMPIAMVEDEEELLLLIKKAKKRLAASCLEGSRYYYEEDLTKDIALVVGNEGNGVSQSLIEKAELKIKIPMLGTIESLNASVAAAIIMYEAVRPRA